MHFLDAVLSRKTENAFLAPLPEHVKCTYCLIKGQSPPKELSYTVAIHGTYLLKSP